MIVAAIFVPSENMKIKKCYIGLLITFSLILAFVLLLLTKTVEYSYPRLIEPLHTGRVEFATQGSWHKDASTWYPRTEIKKSPYTCGIFFVLIGKILLLVSKCVI